MNESAQWRDLLHKKDREIEALHRQIDRLTQQLRRLNGRVYGCSSERSAELQEQLCLFEDASRKAALGESSEASVLCRAAGAYRPVCWRRSCTANMYLRSRFTDRSRSCAGSVCPFPGRPCPTGSLLPESAGSCRYITRCTRSFLQIRSCMRMKRRSWYCGSRSVRHGSAAMYGSTEPPAMRCGLLCFMITSRAEPASARAGS